MNFFEKLMLANQLSFMDGKIELLGQRFVIAPSNSLAIYTSKISNDTKLSCALYRAAKQTVREGFGVNVGRIYSFSFWDYYNWFLEIAKFGGWGIIRWVKLDKKGYTGTISIENSPIGLYLKGVAKEPCDHFIRGLMAGGASTAFKAEVDIIETECIALGNKRCVFVIDSNENLKSKFPDLYRKQLKA